MSEDAELLRRYATDHSEAAFTEMIRRHVDLVYSAALRLVNGDMHRAEDVTQQVFTELARQAKKLVRHPALAGWLYTTTRLIALRTIRTEQRRATREQEAHIMNELLREPDPQLDWNQLRPVLEDAMHELGENDRHAVLLRFFQNKNLKEVGAALGLNENAARMRVDRALDKLRIQLGRRGVTSSSAALILLLSANAVTAAPSALVGTLASASLTNAAAAGSTITFLNWITMTKLQTGIISAMVVAGIATPMIVHRQAQAKLRVMNQSLQQQTDQLARLQADHERLSNLLAGTGQLSPNNSADLQRLRDQLGALRQQAGELAALQEESQKQHASVAAAMARLRQDLSGSNGVPTLDSEEVNARSDYCMRLGGGMRKYAEQHHGQFPTNLADAFNAFPANYWTRTNFMNYKPDEFEIIYHGPVPKPDQYAHPSDIILIREKRPWKNTDGNWVKVYTMLSGLGYTHSQTDESFDAWESRRTVHPSP